MDVLGLDLDMLDVVSRVRGARGCDGPEKCLYNLWRLHVKIRLEIYGCNVRNKVWTSYGTSTVTGRKWQAILSKDLAALTCQVETYRYMILPLCPVTENVSRSSTIKTTLHLYCLEMPLSPSAHSPRQEVINKYKERS